MILGVEKELSIFLQAILTGNFLRLIYSALEILRKIIPHSPLWVGMEDLLYWIFVSGYLFVFIQETSSGIIRWYLVMGLLGGSLVTHYFLRKIVRKYIDKSGKRE